MHIDVRYLGFGVLTAMLMRSSIVRDIMQLNRLTFDRLHGVTSKKDLLGLLCPELVYNLFLLTRRIRLPGLWPFRIDRL